MKRIKQRCWNCKHGKVEGGDTDGKLGGTMYYVCGLTKKPCHRDGLYCQKWESAKPPKEKK